MIVLPAPGSSGAPASHVALVEEDLVQLGLIALDLRLIAKNLVLVSTTWSDMIVSPSKMMTVGLGREAPLKGPEPFAPKISKNL